MWKGNRRGKKGAKKAVARRAWKRRAIRRAAISSRTFTEVIDAGFIESNSGGTFKVQFNSLPQVAEYSKLYRQFCIKKLQVMLLPLYTDAEINTALTTVDFQATRVAFAVNDTPELTVPVSELDVLQSNGAKVVLGHRKITMNCYPKPDLTAVQPGALYNTYIATRQRRAVWLNTDATGQAYSGTGVSHGGISYWCTNNPATIGVDVFKVYYKLTFAMRDPC